MPHLHIPVCLAMAHKDQLACVGAQLCKRLPLSLRMQARGQQAWCAHVAVGESYLTDCILVLANWRFWYPPHLGILQGTPFIPRHRHQKCALWHGLDLQAVLSIVILGGASPVCGVVLYLGSTLSKTVSTMLDPHRSCMYPYMMDALAMTRPGPFIR